MFIRLTALLLASLAAAFAAAPAKPPKPVPVRTDREVEQVARAKFAASKISEDKFTIRVQNGVAVIEGSTNVIQRKGVASRLAKLAGAKSVDNRIRISEEARRAASLRLAEGRKKAAVKKAARAELARKTPPASIKPTIKPSAPKTVVAVAAPPVATIRRAQIKH